MPVLVFPSGLPLPHGSFQLLRALHSLLRSFPVSATHLTMNLPVFFSVSSKSSSQQDMCIYPLIPVSVSILLQALSPVCAGTSKSQSDALHWFCLQRPWGYLLSLGILFFFSTMVENGHIYKQRSLEEHLGQQTAQQRHILAYFHSFASWNSSLEP